LTEHPWTDYIKARIDAADIVISPSKKDQHKTQDVKISDTIDSSKIRPETKIKRLVE